MFQLVYLLVFHHRTHTQTILYLLYVVVYVVVVVVHSSNVMYAIVSFDSCAPREPVFVIRL